MENQIQRSYLSDQQIEKERLDKIYSPADIDITSKRPEEAAVSILAQITQVQSDPIINHASTERKNIISQY